MIENGKIILTKNAIKYTIRHLFNVACPQLVQSLVIDVSEDGVLATTSIFSKKIMFNLSDDQLVNNLLLGEAVLKKIPTADGKFLIPVILKDGYSFAEIKDDLLLINADIITLSFIMLSRYEEMIIKERDKFSRFQFKNSVASKYNFIDFPIVDEYSMILQKYLKEFLPGFKFEIRNCKIIPSHDIDEVRRFDGFKKTLKTILGDIYLYKSTNLFYKSIIQYSHSINKPNRDPYIIAIDTLIRLSKELNLCSEFYFMGASPSKYDRGYDVDNLFIRNIIEKVRENKMIVGLHGGFYTFNNESILKTEKKKVENALGEKIRNSRQHYLRFDVNTTFRNLESVGVKYDSTLGYAEREGFRCGTCFDYNPYDLKKDYPMEIIERPLIVMEVTLFGYRNFDASTAYENILKLYLRCKAVGGNFVILWHNNMVVRKTDWFENIYRRFLVGVS